ncbi:predicted protein [Micromonas commoda]|uniref:Uncharacterized protein n=1 Tax=Micromonas commoda (strain RCC299 / NOUM17 / CCMP2709) TaxID=296587 RepID=C1EJN0_MICCC|nr:predicted protein [Micromonas commoda]ACO68216.1 predicted protein [Micromonas commoda]|eukprot:XP_002506958.1 predicted protein [Micromonas commoda]
MPRPRPCRAVYAHWALSGAPAVFSWFPNQEIPRARREMRKGEAIRLSWCSATAPFFNLRLELPEQTGDGRPPA